jgi:hypothetical protein
VTRVARVTVTLAEQAAIEVALERMEELDREVRQSHLKPLRTLLSKVQEAREPPVTPAGYPVARFLEIVGRSRKVAVPTTAPGHYYSRIARLLGGHGLTDARLEALVRWIDRQTWMKGATSAETVAVKLADWLARAEKDTRAATPVTDTGAPPELEV